MSAGVAIWAPSVGWFYLAYALAGIAYVAVWTIALAMTLEFGEGHEKPSYIGLANTLIAPTAFIIPLLAGWLADISWLPGDVSGHSHRCSGDRTGVELHFA